MKIQEGRWILSLLRSRRPPSEQHHEDLLSDEWPIAP